MTMIHYLKTAIIITLVNEIYAIQFFYDPESKEVFEGMETSLVCQIRGNVTEHELSWYKDDVTISVGRNIVQNSGLNSRQIGLLVNFTSMFDLYTYKLQFNRIDVNDGGAYVCAVNQNKKEFKSNPGFLTVLQLPNLKYPLCKPAISPVTAGESVTVQCDGETLSPPVVLKLFKNGVSIVRNLDKIRKYDVTSLMYSFVSTPSDNNAIFTCQLTTPADDTIIRNCNIGPLDIWYKPNVTIKHTEIVPSGKEVIFLCQVKANPPATDFTWQFDPPLNIDSYYVKGQILRILRVTIDDNYGLIVKCTAKNTVDQGTYQVIMEVNDKVKEEPKTNATELPDQISPPKKKTISLSVFLAIAAVLVVVIVFAIIIPVYYFCFRAKKEQRTVAQPNVYIEFQH